MATQVDPETYFLTPTSHVPNSRFPALVYRRVLDPQDCTAESLRVAIEKNHWLHGGTFKTYWTHHFHSVTHECYAVFNGSSTLSLGKGPLDDSVAGEKVMLSKGDVIVLPAGVAHCSVESSDDYEYHGLYPEGSPHYDNNWCKADRVETEEKVRVAGAVPIPTFDPVYGEAGPLIEIWRAAAWDTS